MNGDHAEKDTDHENPVIRSKLKLFDCHNHIQDKRLFPMLEKVMERARSAGVAKMAIKGCCEKDWLRVEEIANRYPDAYLAFGIHPWFIGGRSGQCFQLLEELLTAYPQASVGEIGIDHAVENRDDTDQEHVFLKQLEIARKYDRPVSIHCRQAWGRLIELLDQFGEMPRGMLIHCFGGSAEIATELVKRGAYISFSGSITRPNARRAGPAIRAVPDDRILIETDAPDILPHNIVDEASSPVQEERGNGSPPSAKPESTRNPNPTERDAQSAVLNEPANLCYILAKAAELRGVTEDTLADTTYRNAEWFFRWWAHGQDAHATEK